MHIPEPTMDLLSHFADGLPKSVVKSYPGEGEDMHGQSENGHFGH